MLILASPFFAWVHYSLRPDIIGWRLLLGAEGPDGTPFSPASYGLLAVLLGILWLVFRIPRRGPLLCAFSTGLVLLALVTPLQMAYGRPEVLDGLTRDREQSLGIIAFSEDHLGFPVGSRSRISSLPRELNLLDRVQAAFRFLHLGWFLLLAGGLLLFSAALLALELPLDRLLVTGLLGALCLLVAGAYLIGPLTAQWQMRRALFNQGAGHYVAAAQNYRKAQRLDPWHQLRPSLWLRIGELQAALGAEGGAELDLYRGRSLEKRGRHEEALEAYQRAMEDAEVATPARRLASEMLTLRGMDLWLRGSPGGAAGPWTTALGLDPERLDTRLFLARSRYLQAQYPESLELAASVLQEAADPFVQAVLYSMMGDCYQRQRRNAEARAMYSLSISRNPERRNPLYDQLAGE